MARIKIQRALAALAFAALFVLQLTDASDDADITCRQSGMCSMGRTKYDYGEIASSSGFKKALKSSSFKREIIIVSTYGTKHLEFIFQLHAQLRRLGMDHFLAISYNEQGCQQVKDVGRVEKKVSCAWDDSPQLEKAWSGGTLLWHLRWRFLARASRIQYNVLSLDRQKEWTTTGPDGKTYSRDVVVERRQDAIRIFTGVGGLYSDAYFKQLREDCDDESKCPWFKDGSGNFTETFMTIPKWFSFSEAGLNHGFLTPLDGSRPRQVMVHYHYMHFASGSWKMAASKIYGGFDWALSKILHVDQSANEKMLPGPYMTGAAPDRVIALSPMIDLSSTRSPREYKMIIAGLLQLAIISNRTVVYPDMPCTAKWLHKGKDGNSACATGDKVRGGDKTLLN
eukprot:gene1116-3949_t